jgi:hypothetical protein
MLGSTDEKHAAEICMNEQREFLSTVAKAVKAAADIGELDNRLSSEIREIRETNAEFRKELKPVLDAYQKGMTLKSKVGTIAICYVCAIVLFPQLSPTSILSVIKMLL